MKRVLLAAVITLSTLTNVAAQEVKTKFSLNPIQLSLANVLNFEYERSFNDGKLGVAFYYGSQGSVPNAIDDMIIFISEQSVTLKNYSNSFASSGWWYGGQISVASGQIYGEEGRANDIGTLGLSAKAGYQIVSGAFYANIFGGIGYALTNDLFGEADYQGNIEESNILIPYGVSLGIAF